MSFMDAIPKKTPPPSFPNSIWERNCLRNSIAQAPLDPQSTTKKMQRLAMELPQQGRSQIEFGNEGTDPSTSLRFAQDDRIVEAEVSP